MTIYLTKSYSPHIQSNSGHLSVSQNIRQLRTVSIVFLFHKAASHWQVKQRLYTWQQCTVFMHQCNTIPSSHFSWPMMISYCLYWWLYKVVHVRWRMSELIYIYILDILWLQPDEITVDIQKQFQNVSKPQSTVGTNVSVQCKSLRKTKMYTLQGLKIKTYLW